MFTIKGNFLHKKEFIRVGSVARSPRYLKMTRISV